MDMKYIATVTVGVFTAGSSVILVDKLGQPVDVFSAVMAVVTGIYLMFVIDSTGISDNTVANDKKNPLHDTKYPRVVWKNRGCTKKEVSPHCFVIMDDSMWESIVDKPNRGTD